MICWFVAETMVTWLAATAPARYSSAMSWAVRPGARTTDSCIPGSEVPPPGSKAQMPPPNSVSWIPASHSVPSVDLAQKRPDSRLSATCPSMRTGIRASRSG